VSDELIILVDVQNRPIGVAPKLASHHADTPLHRAFSCFVFDRQARLLITQRALSKKVFPGIWSNSCCGHPAPGETTEQAIGRRLQDELGMTARKLTCVLPDFRYRAEMQGIVENEICPVYVAISDDAPRPNPAEVENYSWTNWDVFVERVQQQPQTLSYWSVKETEQLLKSDVFAAFLQELRSPQPR
jgi:isopentenyl-diphosphate delta-isomerase